MKTRNKCLKCIVITLFSAFFVLPAQSQVTIGSLSEPLEGTLLDLKETDESTGGANSHKGMIYPRVYLDDIYNLSPIIERSESNSENNPKYTGMTVYNVNTNAPFEKGLYVWNGTKWTGLRAEILAENGLSISPGKQTVELGGELNQETTINLEDKNLIFNHSSGNIGIGTSDPKAPLHIEATSDDPLILNDVKYITDDKNPVDDENSTYYEMRISSGGVVRKVHPVTISQNESFTYTIQSNTVVESGDASGNGGSEMKWSKGADNFDYIELPEDGAYVFSFRLYGTINPGYNSFYLSAFKNSTDPDDLVDIAEMILLNANAVRWVATYSINLTVAGKMNDRIYFKISELSAQYMDLKWELISNGEREANRTSMVFWKL